jgi:hypothetical protein
VEARAAKEAGYLVDSVKEAAVPGVDSGADIVFESSVTDPIPPSEIEAGRGSRNRGGTARTSLSIPHRERPSKRRSFLRVRVIPSKDRA